MPMFPTPKPRQFHYQPRFYDPEKERWEALKQKYADERMLREAMEAADAAATATSQPEATASTATDADLDYFQRRVRELDADERKSNRGLTWKDLVRKREMPKFRYQPRFGADAAASSATDEVAPSTSRMADMKQRGLKIRRRFDMDDPDYLKPVPATRILLYTALACMLIYWIVF